MTETELLCAVAAILSKPGDLTVQDLDELNTINEEIKRRDHNGNGTDHPRAADCPIEV